MVWYGEVSGIAFHERRFITASKEAGLVNGASGQRRIITTTWRNSCDMHLEGTVETTTKSEYHVLLPALVLISPIRESSLQTAQLDTGKTAG